MKGSIQGRRRGIGFLVVGTMALAGMAPAAAPAHATPRPGGAESTNGTTNSGRAAPDTTEFEDRVTLRWTMSSGSAEGAGAGGGVSDGATGGVHRVFVVRRGGATVPLPDVPDGCTASRIDNGVRIECFSPAVPAGEKTPASMSISVTDNDVLDTGASKDAQVRAAREVAQEVTKILAGSVTQGSAASPGRRRAPGSGESP